MAHRSRFDGTHRPGPGLAFVRADKCGEDRAAGAPRDAIYYLQLARQARRLAAEHTDPDVARRLRESAVRHEHMARQLKRQEDRIRDESRLGAGLKALLRTLRGRG